MEHQHTNRLVNEKSPYLLQHAYNPVDWYPWSDEAFEKAKVEDKPVFLSIGYSTCHWCHVMARESFDDPEVAHILNGNYVSIKVDREERPDIDDVYMTVCSALTGQGGWPLTIIMTPAKKPFFAGTYYPKTSRYGRPGLLDILEHVARRWEQDRHGLLDMADQVISHVRIQPQLKGSLSRETLDDAFEELERSYDSQHGGFGQAPKFPTPVNLFFLLRYHRATGKKQALAMVENTLTALRKGGIYDQVGFGFHRYSTDKQWLAPHFEKMLYDNALLALAYLEAFQVTKREFYACVAREIFAYLLRDMSAHDGAFACAQDADSQGKEGIYYTWTPPEVLDCLGETEGSLFCRYYGITEEGNFEEGRSIPNLLGKEAENLQPSSDHKRNDLLEKRLERARIKLLQARGLRVPPQRDDKILTAWNGLAIAALARGSRVLGSPSLLARATNCADFILKNLRREDGRLLACEKRSKAGNDLPAYLDDYAFLVWGLLELWEAGFKPAYLREAVNLTREQIKLFWDESEGGFFFTGRDAEELILRRKEAHDGVMPSGNSVSASNLLRLSRLTGEESWRDQAEALFDALAGQASGYPTGYLFFLSSWILSAAPPLEVVLAGSMEDSATKLLWDALRSEFLPEGVLIINPGGEDGKTLAGLSTVIEGKEPQNGQALAYVCQDLTCRQPVSSPEELRELLGLTAPHLE